MHLTIELECVKKTFEKSIVSAIDMIEVYGKAITIAKKLKGFWLVFENGDLSSHPLFQKIGSLPVKMGILTIDENLIELHAFGRILEGRNIDLVPSIHFHYKDDSTIEEIDFDKEKRLYYLKTIREEYKANEVMGLINQGSA